jgi:hypothetical protein
MTASRAGPLATYLHLMMIVSLLLLPVELRLAPFGRTTLMGPISNLFSVALLGSLAMHNVAVLWTQLTSKRSYLAICYGKLS